MKIEICETTIASRDIDRLKNFYAEVLGPAAEVQHREFFYTVKDRVGQVSIVPHNGDARWNEPWITLSTDNLPEAIEHLKKSGVDAAAIESFGAVDDNGKPVSGVTFRDPDGRLVMMMSEDK